MLDDAEVFSPHAKHGSAVDLCLPADEVRLLGVKVLAVLVLPCLPGVVAVIEKDGRCVPVQFFLRHERSALKDEDLLTGLGKFKRKRPATRSGADDDRVVFSRHDN